MTGPCCSCDRERHLHRVLADGTVFWVCDECTWDPSSDHPANIPDPH